MIHGLISSYRVLLNVCTVNQLITSLQWFSQYCAHTSMFIIFTIFTDFFLKNHIGQLEVVIAKFIIKEPDGNM